MPFSAKFVGLLILVITVLGIPIAVSELAGYASEEANYERTLAACNRAQPLRVVQYTNTLSAIDTTRKLGDYANEGGFLVSQVILLTTPGIDPNTGAISCTEVVEQP